MLRQLLSLSVGRALSDHLWEWAVPAAALSAPSPWQCAITSTSTQHPSSSSSSNWQGCLPNTVFSTGGATRAASTKTKAPASPKRLLTSMNFFVKQNYATVKAELGLQSSKDVITELGARWKRMSEAEKAPYKQQAEQEKSKPEWVAYKAAKELSAIYKTTGYQLYIKEAFPLYKKQLADPKDHTQAMKLAAQGWNQLTLEQKKVYNDNAEAIRASIK